jgi:hypothetical protein
MWVFSYFSFAFQILVFSVFLRLIMVEPISIIAIGLGTVTIITSILATMGIIVAPEVSSPADKYVNIKYYDHPYDRIENL